MGKNVQGVRGNILKSETQNLALRETVLLLNLWVWKSANEKSGSETQQGNLGPKAIQALGLNFTLAAEMKPYVQHKNSTFILAIHTCEEY